MTMAAGYAIYPLEIERVDAEPLAVLWSGCKFAVIVRVLDLNNAHEIISSYI